MQTILGEYHLRHMLMMFDFRFTHIMFLHGGSLYPMKNVLLDKSVDEFILSVMVFSVQDTYILLGTFF